MPAGFVYILECCDGSYYTGSTIDIEKRLIEHNEGKGSNHTKKRLPVNLVYLEEFQRIDDAFYREKQIQGWNRQKKEALINSEEYELPELSLAYRDKEASRTSASKTNDSSVSDPLEDTKTKIFRSNGKLLLTGEYLVLDGAKALAIPTKFGQSLEVNSNSSKNIAWKSFDHQGKVWFENTFSLDAKKHSGSDSIPDRLIDIFNAIKELNPNILNQGQGYSFKSHLEFPQDWGLGSSSTLLNNLATWANIDSYELLEKTFGGSGYDIACAQNSSPITYQLDNKKRTVSPVGFAPDFSDSLYFVHLNQKQNSREGIATYNSKKGQISQEIDEINNITDSVINCSSLKEFNTLIEKHEQIISNIIDQETVKNRLFLDFTGSIKSLGAWGGDFVLITSKDNPRSYFKDKGYQTIIPYKEMVIN